MSEPVSLFGAKPLAAEEISEAAKADALVAIELARGHGIYDDEQIARIAPLVRWLRADTA